MAGQRRETAIPTVPVLQQQVQLAQRPSVRLGDFSPSSQGLVSGIGELGQILEQERARADQTAVSSADTARESWTNTRLYDPQNGAFTREGANALGVTNEVLSDYDKHVTDVMGGLNSRRQQAAFIANASNQRAAIQGQLARFESAQRGKYEDDAANSRVSTAIDSAALAYTDPTTQALSRGAIENMLTEQKARKGWDDSTFQAQRNAALSNLHEAVVTNMLANRNIPLAQAYFNTNQSELDAVGRDKILNKIDSTMRSEWADMERLQGLSDKHKKQAADTLSKDGDKLLASGALSAKWIEANRGLMDPNDYRYFYQKLQNPTGAEGPRNVTLYADLRDAAGRGEDVREEARQALTRGEIRVGDYDRLVGEVESERPGWYKRGADYIKSMSGMSLLNPPPDAPQRYARLTDEWNDWAATHKDATDVQAQAAYQDLVASRMLVDRAGLPPLKYLVGDALQPDIEATKRATDKAFKDGLLTPEAYQRQKDILVQYWRTMPKAPAKKAP